MCVGSGIAQGIHLGAEAEEVHRDDRLGARLTRARQVVGVDVVGVAVDVDEDRRRAAVDDDVGGCHPGESGNDHLVAGADAERREGEVQCRRATGRRERV